MIEVLLLLILLAILAPGVIGAVIGLAVGAFVLIAFYGLMVAGVLAVASWFGG